VVRLLSSAFFSTCHECVHGTYIYAHWSISCNRCPSSLSREAGERERSRCVDPNVCAAVVHSTDCTTHLHLLSLPFTECSSDFPSVPVMDLYLFSSNCAHPADLWHVCIQYFLLVCLFPTYIQLYTMTVYSLLAPSCLAFST